jgi:hypothetical protein
MKPAKHHALFTAVIIALSSIYGCSDGDDTSINITNPDGGGGGGGGTGTISTNCPDWASARPIDSDGNDVCQLPSEILVNRTLTSDIVWFMQSRVTVGNGNRAMSVTEGVLDNDQPVLNVVLTVEPGTQIKGRSGSFANMVITRGSQIDAVGTADAPIVFSSDDADFEGSGEWGGLVMHGYAPHNGCLLADEGVVPCNIDSEGESGFGGGYSPDDSSGRLNYVVVTEGGFEFAPGNEINGISLIGVGSGTEMEYLQVNSNADDGIEFFGGTVNVKYLVLTGNLDDSVDWDEGYQGNLQYVLVVQSADTEGSAIEADTLGSNDFDSKPTIANATFIGNGSIDRLWVFKEESGGFLLNTIGTVAEGNTALQACVEVRGAGAQANIGSTLAFNNVNADCPTFGFDAASDLLGAVGVSSFDPELDANFAAQAPDASGVDLDIATFKATYPESVADEDFFDATDFLGAVDPSASAAWFDSWIVEGSL